MAIVFARVVACEEYPQASDFKKEHSCTEDVAGGVWGETDGGDGVGGVVVDGFNLGEGGEVLGFGVEGCTLVGGGGEAPAYVVRGALGEGMELAYCTRTLSCMSHL